MKHTCTKQRLVKVLALGGAFGVTAMMPGMAGAQPNVGGGQGQNPPNQNPGGGGGNRPDFRTMTPEQRQQFFEQQRGVMQEQMLRGMMQRAGFTNPAQQNTVVTFAKAQDAAQQSLQEMADKLVAAVSTVGVSDTEVARLLKEFQDAVAAEKERRKIARADLDKQVNYSKAPRLEMALTMLGILSDDSLMGNMGGRMFGGRGGFGGQPGGQGGGQPGGQGGGRQN